jgi:Bacteriophage Sf6, terminase small subunit-like
MRGQAFLGGRGFEINAMDHSRAIRTAYSHPPAAATSSPRTTKRPRRRRHDYSPEIADLICDRLMEGRQANLSRSNVPARSTIFVWLEEHEDFARSYAQARRIQIEDLVEESLEIADDSSEN